MQMEDGAAIDAVRAPEREARVPGGRGFRRRVGEHASRGENGVQEDGTSCVSRTGVGGGRGLTARSLGAWGTPQSSTQAGTAEHGCRGAWGARSLRKEEVSSRHWSVNLGTVHSCGPRLGAVSRPELDMVCLF